MFQPSDPDNPEKDATDDSKNTFSKVNLVDLAGSERAKSTEAVGDRLKERGSKQRQTMEI